MATALPTRVIQDDDVLQQLLASAAEQQECEEKSSNEKKHPMRKKRSINKGSETTTFTGTPVTEEYIVKFHVRSMLAMDRTMEQTATPNVNKVIRRTGRQDTLQEKRHEAADKLAATGRTSVARARRVHEPTVNKKRYREEKEKKRLLKLARMFKRLSSKQQKAKK